jgi:hypothetical protein
LVSNLAALPRIVCKAAASVHLERLEDIEERVVLSAESKVAEKSQYLWRYSWLFSETMNLNDSTKHWKFKWSTKDQEV